LFVLLRRKKIHHAASVSPAPASQYQTEQTHSEENEMTKLLSTVAAFVLFAPIAVAILMQAALIVA
jgi:hypothetical protein